MTIAPERLKESIERIQRMDEHRKTFPYYEDVHLVIGALGDLLAERAQGRKVTIPFPDGLGELVPQPVKVFVNIAEQAGGAMWHRLVPIDELVRMLDKARPDAWSKEPSPPAASAQSVAREVGPMLSDDERIAAVNSMMADLNEPSPWVRREVAHAAIAFAFRMGMSTLSGHGIDAKEADKILAMQAEAISRAAAAKEDGK